MKKSKSTDNTIVINRKARFNYFLEEEFEAGIVLQGWEVKSLRAGKINLSDAHIILRQNEAFLLNSEIQPLPTAAAHLMPEVGRTRKLLLSRKQLNSFIGNVNREGYTVVPLSLYWKNNRVKLKVALAKGKKTHDKRETEKTREWEKTKSRLLKTQR